MTAVAGTALLNPLKWQVIGGTAAVLAILISLVHISRHLRYNTSRDIKRCTLRILLLVPFYALDCLLSLVLNDSRQAWPYLLTAFREFYEAVVLSAFMQLVLTFLGRRRDGSMGGPQAVGEAFCAAMRTPSHASMNSRLAFVPVIYSPGVGFVSGVLIGILQYAVVMVAVLAADIGIWYRWGAKVNALCTGGFCVWKIPFYIKGASCGWAMYNLTLFYFEAKMCKELRERLELIHPHNKFFSVKMIIFFTFFQKLVVGTVLKDWFHVFDPFAGGSWTTSVVAEGFQTFLLCVEMLVFAVWHVQAYPVDEFNKLDAAASLQAAIAKESRLDLKSAVREAVNAGLGDEHETHRMAAEWRELLERAKALLNELYPEVKFEGESSEFVLKTSHAATVRLLVDAQRGRLCVTSFGSGGVEADEAGAVQVTLTEPAQALRPARQSTWRSEDHKRMQTMQEDLAVLVHNLCSPSGEVGFLGTWTMYKDILLLNRCAKRQRRAVKLLRRSCYGKQPLSDKEAWNAFTAFDENGRRAITRQNVLHVFVSNAGDEAEAAAMLDRMGLEEASELKFDDFKRFVSGTGSKGLEAPLLAGGDV